MQRGQIVMSDSVDEVRGRLDEIEATYLAADAAPSDAG
jgi:hypothetical protein